MTEAYFATARVVDVVPDRARADHFYALMDSYLDFARAVPFREGQHYSESAIQRDDGATNKAPFGREAAHSLKANTGRLCRLASRPVHKPASAAPFDAASLAGFAEPPSTFERPIVERVVARPFREAALSGSIKSAYDDTCAFTGLKIINGGGRSEVQAAHIRPVAASGPDLLRTDSRLADCPLDVRPRSDFDRR